MGKVIAIVIVSLIGITLVGYGLQVIFFPAHVLNNEIQTAHDVVDKTINADNAIYNYEWFKRQKESIDATGKKLTIAQNAITSFEQSAGVRSTWTFEDKGEDARLRAISQGIESQLKDMIAEYNARTKMANRAIFQDGILPNFIDAAMFEFKN